MPTQVTSKLSLLRLQGTQLLNSIHSLNQSAYPPQQIPQLSLLKDLSSSLSKAAVTPQPESTTNASSATNQSTGAISGISSQNIATLLSNLSRRKIPKKDMKILDTYSKRIMMQYEDLWLWIEKLMAFVDEACLEIVQGLWVMGFKDLKGAAEILAPNVANLQEESIVDSSGGEDADAERSTGSQHSRVASSSGGTGAIATGALPKKKRLLHIRHKSEVLSVDLSFVKEIMNVLTILCKILLGLEGGAITNYVEKVALYNLAYKSLQSNGKNHKTYVLLQNLLQKFSPNPLAHLQQIFSPTVNDVMCPLLNQLIDTYDRTDFRRLKTELAVELLSNPQQISMPSIDQIHFELTHTGTIDEWLLFGLLVFPEALFWGEKSKQAHEYNEKVRASIKISDGKKIKKSKNIKEKKIVLKELTPQLQFLQDRLLATSYVLSVGSNKVIFLHDLYEQLFATNKVLKKLKKKWVRQTEATAAKRSHVVHAEYRAYCRKYLHEVLSLLEENRGIIAVKFQLILSLFSLAQKELLWYFHHSLKPKAPAAQSVTVKDEFVHEIIYLVERITKLCISNKSLITAYNRKLLRLPFRSELIRVIGTVRPLLDEHIMNCVNRILSDIEQDNIEQFDALRLNWRNLLVYICKSAPLVENMDNPAVKHFLSLLDQIALISAHVDHVSDQLLHHGGLAQLYFFTEQISQIFQESLVGTDTQPLYAMSLIRLLAFFPENAHRTFNQQLRQALGVKAINDAQDMLQKLAKFIGSDLMEEYVLLFERVTASTQTSTAVPEVQSVRSSSRLPKIISPVDDAEKLARLKMNLCRLIIGVGESGTLDIHNVKFHPSEFIKDELELFVERFISQNIAKETTTPSASKSKTKRNSVGEPVQPSQESPLPSIMLQRFSSLIQALTIIEETLNLNVQEIVCKCMLEYFYIDLDQLKAGKENIVTRYAHHVCRLITSPADDKTVIFQDNRLVAHDLVSSKELEALVTIGGPYTVRVVDAVICQHLEKHVRRLRSNLDTVTEDFDQIIPRFFSEQLKDHELRALPNLQDAVHLLVPIGALFELRRTIHSVLQNTMKRKTPVLFNVVNLCGIQLDDSSYLQHIGVKIDTRLKTQLRDYLQDSATWKILHVVFALGNMITNLGSTTKGGTTQPEAWSKNRMLSVCGFVDLLALLHSKKEQTEILRQTSRFMIAVLLQLRATQHPKQYAGSVIFVDNFLRLFPDTLSQDEVDDTLPVDLIRGFRKVT